MVFVAWGEIFSYSAQTCSWKLMALHTALVWGDSHRFDSRFLAQLVECISLEPMVIGGGGGGVGLGWQAGQVDDFGFRVIKISNTDFYM